MRAPTLPLSCQVPSPSTGTVAPFALMTSISRFPVLLVFLVIPILPRGRALHVPRRRLRRIDDPRVGLLQGGDLAHLGGTEREIEHLKILLLALRLGRARDHDDALLHQPAQ